MNLLIAEAKVTTEMEWMGLEYAIERQTVKG